MAAPNSGARLTDLRELLQLTQTELAAKADVPQSTISSVERGQRALSPALLTSICRAVRMPLSFFDSPPAPTDPTAVHFRRTAGAGMKATRAALRHFEELQRITDQLMQTSGTTPMALESVTSDITGADIEDIATATRDELGIPRANPITHVMRAIERAGAAVAPLVQLGADHPAFDDHSGMSRATSKSALVMYTPTSAGDRQRFTAAHELGHLKLHRHRHVRDERSREREAHRFAGAFLYPREVAECDISESLSLNGYARIKARWGTAIQALIRRGRDLRLISQDRHRSLMIQVSSRGWRKHEPVEVGIEHPILLWRMLSLTYGDAPYMTASHALGIDPQRLQLWIPNRASAKHHSGDVVVLFRKQHDTTFETVQ